MHMINIVFIMKSEFSMSFKKVLYIQLCLHRSYVCVCMLLMTANYLWEGYRPEERGTLRGGFSTRTLPIFMQGNPVFEENHGKLRTIWPPGATEFETSPPCLPALRAVLLGTGVARL